MSFSNRAPIEQPEKCELCDRKARYYAHAGPHRVVGACAEHRSLAVRVMFENTVHHEARYHAARAAKPGTRFVERGYNVGRHSGHMNRNK